MTNTFTIPKEAFEYARRLPDGTIEGNDDVDFYILLAVQYLINNKKLLIPNDQISNTNELEDELENLRYKFDKLEDAYADLSLDNQKLLKNLKETNESLEAKESEIRQLRSNLEELKMRLKTSVRSF
jgi:peptidoglycan hydrolase CwlO-like protein